MNCNHLDAVYDLSPIFFTFYAFCMCMYEYPSLVAGEHVYELAMYLDLLNSSCFPTWHHVFAIAEQVMMTLSLSDPDLYTHLKSIAKTNMQVNKKVCIRYQNKL